MKIVNPTAARRRTAILFSFVIFAILTLGMKPVLAGDEKNTDTSTDTGKTEGTHPKIHLEKTADQKTLPAGGGEVTYTYEVTNPGKLGLTDVKVTDDKCSPVKFEGGDDNKNKKLDPDETWTYSCTMEVTETTTNKATATGKFCSCNEIATATAEATVTVLPPTPPPPPPPPPPPVVPPVNVTTNVETEVKVKVEEEEDHHDHHHHHKHHHEHEEETIIPKLPVAGGGSGSVIGTVAPLWNIWFGLVGIVIAANAIAFFTNRRTLRK